MGEYQKRDPEKVRVWRSRHRAKVRGSAQQRARNIHENMVRASRKRGWGEPEFSIATIRAIIETGRCEKTGVPFDLTPPARVGLRSPWGPSPDRIDTSRGYSKGNVQWVCLMYNVAKSNWSDREVEEMAKKLLGGV